MAETYKHPHDFFEMLDDKYANWRTIFGPECIPIFHKKMSIPCPGTQTYIETEHAKYFPPVGSFLWPKTLTLGTDYKTKACELSFTKSFFGAFVRETHSLSPSKYLAALRIYPSKVGQTVYHVKVEDFSQYAYYAVKDMDFADLPRYGKAEHLTIPSNEILGRFIEPKITTRIIEGSLDVVIHAKDSSSTGEFPLKDGDICLTMEQGLELLQAEFWRQVDLQRTNITRKKLPSCGIEWWADVELGEDDDREEVVFDKHDWAFLHLKEDKKESMTADEQELAKLVDFEKRATLAEKIQYGKITFPEAKKADGASIRKRPADEQAGAASTWERPAGIAPPTPRFHPVTGLKVFEWGKK